MARLSSLVLHDLVLYADPCVVDGGGGGVGCLVRLCVRAAIGVSLSFLLLSKILMTSGM